MKSKCSEYTSPLVDTDIIPWVTPNITIPTVAAKGFLDNVEKKTKLEDNIMTARTNVRKFNRYPRLPKGKNFVNT